MGNKLELDADGKPVIDEKTGKPKTMTWKPRSRSEEDYINRQEAPKREARQRQEMYDTTKQSSKDALKEFFTPNTPPNNPPNNPPREGAARPDIKETNISKTNENNISRQEITSKTETHINNVTTTRTDTRTDNTDQSKK